MRTMPISDSRDLYPCTEPPSTNESGDEGWPAVRDWQTRSAGRAIFRKAVPGGSTIGTLAVHTRISPQPGLRLEKGGTRMLFLHTPGCR